jgi:hypothetical protein
VCEDIALVTCTFPIQKDQYGSYPYNKSIQTVTKTRQAHKALSIAFGTCTSLLMIRSVKVGAAVLRACAVGSIPTLPTWGVPQSVKLTNYILT